MGNPSTAGRSWFGRFAGRTAKWAGHPATFGVAVGVIVVWAACGPAFKFSDTWQLVINTSTTIVTFLMVFLIQNTQNRDTHALQVKLDELIHATREADNAVLDVEELDEAELEALRRKYEAMAHEAVRAMRSRGGPRGRGPTEFA